MTAADQAKPESASMATSWDARDSARGLENFTAKCRAASWRWPELNAGRRSLRGDSNPLDRDAELEIQCL